MNKQIFVLNECKTEHLLKFHFFHSLDNTECVILFHLFLTVSSQYKSNQGKSDDQLFSYIHRVHI